jgi:hypothetical protein
MSASFEGGVQLASMPKNKHGINPACLTLSNATPTATVISSNVSDSEIDVLGL